MNEALDIVY